MEARQRIMRDPGFPGGTRGAPLAWRRRCRVGSVVSWVFWFPHSRWPGSRLRHNGARSLRPRLLSNTHPRPRHLRWHRRSTRLRLRLRSSTRRRRRPRRRSSTPPHPSPARAPRLLRHSSTRHRLPPPRPSTRRRRGRAAAAVRRPTPAIRRSPRPLRNTRRRPSSTRRHPLQHRAPPQGLPRELPLPHRPRSTRLPRRRQRRRQRRSSTPPRLRRPLSSTLRPRQLERLPPFHSPRPRLRLPHPRPQLRHPPRRPLQPSRCCRPALFRSSRRPRPLRANRWTRNRGRRSRRTCRRPGSRARSTTETCSGSVLTRRTSSPERARQLTAVEFYRLVGRGDPRPPRGTQGRARHPLRLLVPTFARASPRASG
jgi:hypothetical protein